MKKENELKTEDELSRRKVLKKVAYVAPVIAGLGALSAPVSVQAEVSRIGIDPGFGGNEQTEN